MTGGAQSVTGRERRSVRAPPPPLSASRYVTSTASPAATRRWPGSSVEESAREPTNRPEEALVSVRVMGKGEGSEGEEAVATRKPAWLGSGSAFPSSTVTSAVSRQPVSTGVRNSAAREQEAAPGGTPTPSPEKVLSLPSWSTEVRAMNLATQGDSPESEVR